MISVTLHYCMSLIGNARNVMSYSCTGNVSNLYRNVAMLYHCFECLPLAAITDRSSIKLIVFQFPKDITLATSDKA